MTEEVKKPTTLPLTQALMSQRAIKETNKLGPFPEKNVQPYYASILSQKSYSKEHHEPL